MELADVRPLAADGVVVHEGTVLLLERAHPPHEGEWVLPGGFVDPGERARTAAEREVNEETGLDVEAAAFVGLYDAPGRDERGNVSAAYRCRPLADDPSPEPVEEARRVAWFPPGDLPPMGFDHAEMVADAVG
jgi:8-oxo-dGTP diphosphatase